MTITLRGRHGEPHDRVQQLVDETLRGISRPQVLEAGCGSLSRIRLPGDSVVVGIDIEQRQLDRNTALHQKVLGDLQTHRWDAGAFDLVLCWDVIEHLSDPLAALHRIGAALRPGGVVVLAFPNLWSLKGLVTKLTPFGFHALFYRYVVGDRRHRDEWDQFPTYFRSVIAPPRLRSWARGQGLSIAYDEVYEGPVQTDLRARSAVMNVGFAALSSVSKLVSLGSLDLGLSDCVLILRRPALAESGGT